ncbi:hypothetical protein CGCSCA4_v003611 [Colletotrichum siamense]|uniref:Uncharacterized protein n=1 Tax=Colletotrichum siamense TaxID=690259 RepID=A0A9P5F0N3_COLSI|nr:hypothetical protein CGCSCA4_v003611 [Colletotrichum siamense]KAF4863045.1 hypothetical protein CGCSCA2_v003168 [Colletotrichum siamense]
MTMLQKRTSIPLALPTSLPPKSERLQSLAIRQDRWTKYTIPNVDAEAVCRAVTLHKAFELQEGYVIPDLPKFSDLTSYGDLKEEDDDELCELEARRLVQTANSDTAIRFEGSDSMLGPADAKGYFRLHWLGQRLIQALQICKHDALVVMIEHIDRNLRGYAGTQERLLAYFDPATGDERFSGPLLLQGEEYQRYYHAMVNYLTAVLVKIVLQSFRSTYWINNIIAVIARISAKMKVVGHDLPAATEQTLQNGSDARSRIQKQETKNAAYYANNPGFGFNRNYKAAPPLQNRAGYATKYFSEMDLLHNAVIHMLIDSLSAFAVSNHLAPGVDEFESSIALYESFITSEQILLCEQRDGGIGAASETGVTRAFTAGFEVCLRTWEALEKEPTSHTNVSWTSLKWRCSYVDDEGELRPKSRKGAVKLGFMTRVITATVPYAMSSGTFSASLHNLIDKILFSSGKDNRFALLLVEQPKMICTAILRTSQYESRRPTERENSDACPVSETFLLQKRAVGHNENGSSSDTYAQTLSWAVKSPNKTVTLSDREQAKKNLEAVKNKYFKWVTDANAIVISCKWYTWGSLVGCAILVLGGLAVGFTVGDRIHGVDPFNISVFCWVLAGFILLVAKAFRVENWPWSHFLRGQVTCRSVGEVVAVSGVDEQLLLALLLRIDSQIYLRTRGPFDILFLRHTDDIQGGFSIDAPIKMSTAVEGGLIPIKILADWGIGLIFLSARSWSSYNVISSSQNFKEELVCKDITHPASWVDGKIPCYRIRWEEVYIHQVLGVFEQECYFY